MPQTSPYSRRILLEQLETRQLLADVNVVAFGAVPNDGLDDTAAFNLAIRAALGGNTVVVPAGKFTFGSSITVPSNVIIQGAGGTASELDFTIDRSGFALNLEANASNIKIDGLAIRSNDGIIALNSGVMYRNIAITNNDLQWGYDGTYYHRLAVQSLTASTGLIIENNYFHDSSLSDRNVDLWDMSDGSYSYNTFYYVNDGGHINDSRDNVTVSYNVGRKIHRMGIEIQTWSGLTTNLTVQGNVFYDWDRPYTDSFGLSVMPQDGLNVKILDNYVSAIFTGPWGPGVDGNDPHFGIGIEAGFTTGIVENNTVIGPWVFGIMCSMPNTLVQGNKIFGTQKWGSITTEGGLFGQGSFISVNNTIDPNLADAPPPPDTVAGGGGTDFPPPGDPTGGGGTTQPSTPPTGIAPYLTAFVNDGTRISLSWIDSYTDESGYRVERSVDGQSYTVIYDSLAPNVVMYQDQGLPSGTQVWYRVAAYKGNTQGDYSNVVVARTKGPPPAGGLSNSMSMNSNGMSNYVAPPTQLIDDKINPTFGNTLITL